MGTYTDHRHPEILDAAVGFAHQRNRNTTFDAATHLVVGLITPGC